MRAVAAKSEACKEERDEHVLRNVQTELSRPAIRKLRLLRLRPFDVSTPDGRADERQRRAALSSLSALAAKALSMSSQLISVPLTLGYLGTERFGVWATLSSLLAMLAFADFGIGNGLLNVVSEAHGRNDTAAMRRHVASAFTMLGSVALLILTAFAFAYPLIGWGGVFNVGSVRSAAEVGPAVAALVLCLALNVPATVVQRLQLGLQMGFIANLWQAIGSVLALVALLAVIRAHGSIAALVLAFAGTPILAALLNGWWFFGKVRVDLKPRWNDVSRYDGRRLLRNGTLFLILQIVASVTYLSDAIVIAHELGAGSVTTYAVPEKLFSLIAVTMAILVQPLWPAYAEALSRGDRLWVKSALRRSLWINGSIAVTASLLLFLITPTLIKWWTGRDLQVPLLLLAGFAVWKIIEALGLAVSVYLNGSNLIREQLFMAVITAIVALALKFWLVGIIGVAGTVWAIIIAYLVFSVPITIFIVRRSIRNHEISFAVARS